MELVAPGQACHQKRVVEFGEWLCTEVLKYVPHRQWVFSIPKRLRIYFMFDRKLLTKLSRCAWKLLNFVFNPSDSLWWCQSRCCDCRAEFWWLSKFSSSFTCSLHRWLLLQRCRLHGMPTTWYRWAWKAVSLWSLQNAQSWRQNQWCCDRKHDELASGS